MNSLTRAGRKSKLYIYSMFMRLVCLVAYGLYTFFVYFLTLIDIVIHVLYMKFICLDLFNPVYSD